MTYPRRTLARTASLEGLGLHRGVPVTVKIHPGEDGIAFRAGAERILARPENVTDTSRCTTLGPVATIEHLMSTFAGLGVTDAEVEVEGGELPGLDGSAQLYVKALHEAGLEDFGEFEPRLPYSRVFLQDGDVRIAIAMGDGHWRCDYDLGERWPGLQQCEMIAAPGGFAEEIAPARTFALIEEVPSLLEAGLGKGLAPDATFIVGKETYKGATRFDNEPVRHKMLDLLGDLYLAGVPVAALSVVGVRSGHRTNVAAAARLALATAQA